MRDAEQYTEGVHAVLAHYTGADATAKHLAVVMLPGTFLLYPTQVLRCVHANDLPSA